MMFIKSERSQLFWQCKEHFFFTLETRKIWLYSPTWSRYEQPKTVIWQVTVKLSVTSEKDSIDINIGDKGISFL